MVKKTLWLIVVCAASYPLNAYAGVANGNFETGTTAGWTVTGAAHTADATIGVSPTEATYQGYIDNTGNFTAPALTVLSALGVSTPTIAALAVGAPTVGSSITQTVTVSAGDTLTFDWNFLTDELDESATFNDFAIYTIDSAAYLLASRNSSTYNTTSPPAGFDGQTDWANASYTFTLAGTYQIGFAAFNVGDTGHNSVLLLDAITLPVPEPSTVILLAVGLSLCILFRRRGS